MLALKNKEEIFPSNVWFSHNNAYEISLQEFLNPIIVYVQELQDVFLLVVRTLLLTA